MWRRRVTYLKPSFSFDNTDRFGAGRVRVGRQFPEAGSIANPQSKLISSCSFGTIAPNETKLAWKMTGAQRRSLLLSPNMTRASRRRQHRSREEAAASECRGCEFTTPRSDT